MCILFESNLYVLFLTFHGADMDVNRQIPTMSCNDSKGCFFFF